MSSLHRRLSAITLALALGGAGLGFGAAPAVAATRTVVGVVTDHAIADIDAQRTVTLTVRKVQPNPYDEVPDGQLPPAPLGGSVFTAHRINGVDLSTAEGWEMARTISLAEAHARGLTETATAVTSSEGVATFPGLPVGLYYIVETPPDTPGYTYHTAAPFLITLPTGHADGRSWNYEVVVEAKNSPLPTPQPPGGSTVPLIPIPVPIPIPIGGSSVPGSAVPGSAVPGSAVPSEAAPEQPNSVTPGDPEQQTPRLLRLPVTGAGVIGLVLIGLGLIAVGVITMRRARRFR